MKDRRVSKLMKKVGNVAIAEALVEAGFDSPKKIKAANNGDLMKVKGVGQATLNALRVRMPKVK